MRSRYRFSLLLGLMLLCASGYGIGRLYFHLTDGFGPGSIATDFPYETRWDVGRLSSDKQQSLENILQQPFHYFAKGTQSYVLRSDDGQYVIKFFKQKHLKQAKWKQSLASIPLLGKQAQDSLERRVAKKNKIFNGCKIGYESMQKDSGVIYVHLNPSTDLPSDLTFFDKLGVSHHLDPNGLAFYIQRCGISVYRALLAFKAAGDEEGAAKALAGLLEYLVERSQKGIEDGDPNLLNNLGFVDGHPATLDLGGLYRKQNSRSDHEIRQDVLVRTQVIHHWIEGNYPELLHRYAQVLEQFFSGFLLAEHSSPQ